MTIEASLGLVTLRYFVRLHWLSLIVCQLSQLHLMNRWSVSSKMTSQMVGQRIVATGAPSIALCCLAELLFRARFIAANGVSLPSCRNCLQSLWWAMAIEITHCILSDSIDLLISAVGCFFAVVRCSAELNQAKFCCSCYQSVNYVSFLLIVCTHSLSCFPLVCILFLLVFQSSTRSCLFARIEWVKSFEYR